MSNDQTVLTLDNTNSVHILAQYIELAQQKGAYKLNEAEILKRSMDVLLRSSVDPEINDVVAKNLLIQGVMKGQSHGAYTLNDAALLSRVVQFVGTSLQQPVHAEQHNEQQHTDQSAEQSTDQVDELEDLSDLAEPIPLKPKEI